MKKNIYLAICAFLFFSATNNAQDPIPASGSAAELGNMHGVFGVRYLPTFSSFNIRSSSGGEISGDFVMSHGVGGLLGFGGKHLGLQVELIYNTYSQKFKDRDLEKRIDLNYVNIPVLFSVNTNKMNSVNLNICFGPQIGLNVGSKITSTGSSDGVDTLNAVLAVKQGDFGVAYGAGLDFGLNADKTIRLDLGFRGVMGLVDISDHSKTLVTNEYYILQRSKVLTYSGYIGLIFLF